MRKHFLWLGLAAIGIGVFVLLYRGPGRVIVRGHVGDVAATMLVYATLGAIWWRTRMGVRALVALAIAVAIEVGQMFWSARSLVGELLVGNTCDPWDIVAYVLGVGVALVWERTAVARCAACAPSPSH